MICTITGIASLTCAIIVGAILAIKELEVCNCGADNSYMRV